MGERVLNGRIEAVSQKSRSARPTSTAHRPPSTVHRPPSTVHRPPSTLHPLRLVEDDSAAIRRLKFLVEVPLARFQIACDPSPNATLYRFYYQRPILDPEPIFAGHAAEPLFVTESLTAGQQYLVYVSATNEGAESELSEPVSATTQLELAA